MRLKLSDQTYMEGGTVRVHSLCSCTRQDHLTLQLRTWRRIDALHICVSPRYDFGVPVSLSKLG